MDAMEDKLRAEAELLMAKAELLKAQIPELLEKHRDRGCDTVAGRPKFWGELSLEEKIERTREMVHQFDGLNRELYRLRNQLRMLTDRFNSHKHDNNDNAMLPATFTTFDGGLDYGGEKLTTERADPNQVYF